jgi:hypothetical protein
LSRYSGIEEQVAKYELLHYLEFDYLISKKRFSRQQLIKDLSVPNSIARAFSKGKGRSNKNTYKSINEADPKLVWLIKELASRCRFSAQVDKIRRNPNVETNIYRG